MKTREKVIRDVAPEPLPDHAPVASQEVGEPKEVRPNHLVTGPAQDTPQGDALKVHAAIEHAVGSMERVRISISRGPHPSLVPAIEQMKDSFRAAIGALAAGGHEEERTRLFDALGAVLGPLEQLVDQLSGDSRREREMKSALVAAYRELLAPTEPHFWPEQVEANVGPAGKFLPTNNAVEIAQRAFARFE